MTNELVSIILNSNLDKYDGMILKGSYRDSHIFTIIRLAGELKKEGFDLGYFDKTTAEEAAFNIISNGHIVFFNVYNKVAFLKLPKQITQKQFITLKKFEEELNLFETIYVQAIDPSNEETLKSKVYTKNYKVDVLKNIINKTRLS